MEKAASDRHLFQSQGPRVAYELKQPEYVPITVTSKTVFVNRNFELTTRAHL